MSRFLAGLREGKRRTAMQNAPFLQGRTKRPRGLIRGGCSPSKSRLPRPQLFNDTAKVYRATRTGVNLTADSGIVLLIRRHAAY